MNLDKRAEFMNFHKRAESPVSARYSRRFEKAMAADVVVSMAFQFVVGPGKFCTYRKTQSIYAMPAGLNRKIELGIEISE